MTNPLAALVADRVVVVVGSAPLAAPLTIPDDAIAVAVNGGISSVPRGADLVWVLNARTATDATVAGDKRALHDLMLRQGADRAVRLVVLLSKSDGAAAHTQARLRDQHTAVVAAVEIPHAERRALETAAGARTPDLTKHALSAGLFAAAACLHAGAAVVRLEGCSWEGGYAYLPGADVRRGHDYGDKRALRALMARYGARFIHSLPGVAPMPTPSSPSRGRAASTAPRPRPRRVRATKLLQYNLRRMREGEVFELRDPSHFKASCMAPVADDAPIGPGPVSTEPPRPLPWIHHGTLLQPNAADPVEPAGATDDVI